MRHVDEREGGSISATYCLKVHRALIRLILLGNSAVAETVSLNLLTLLKIPARKRIWHWVSLLWVLKWPSSSFRYMWLSFMPHSDNENK